MKEIKRMFPGIQFKHLDLDEITEELTKLKALNHNIAEVSYQHALIGLGASKKTYEAKKKVELAWQDVIKTNERLPNGVKHEHSRDPRDPLATGIFDQG